jgi:hypothetical protein
MSFQNVKLLECNREQSTEKNNDSDNNAIFTNRMGEIIELNPGDEISLQSAFINKRGTANLNSIEFKGRSLGVTGTFRQTSTAKENPTTYSINNRYKEVFVYTDYTSEAEPTQDNTTQNNVAFRQIYKEDIVKDLRDNELNLETIYYKTTNGENYAVMPKLYLRTDLHELNNNVDSGIVHTFPLIDIGGDDSTKYFDSQYFNRCDNDIDMFEVTIPSSGGGTDLNMVVYSKGIMSGVSRYAPNTFIGYGHQMGIYNYIDSFCSADYRRVQQIVGYSTFDGDITDLKKPPATSTYFGQPYSITENAPVIIAPDRSPAWFPESTANPTISNNYKRLLPNYYEDIRAVQENEKFTLFEREFDFMMYYNGDEVPSIPFIDKNNVKQTLKMNVWWENIRFENPSGAPALPDGFPFRFTRMYMRSPALYPYLKRSKVNTITLNKGYSTPQSIAEQISEQLQKQDTDSPYIYEKTINGDTTNSGSPNYGNAQQIPAYTTAFQTRFFEPISCANRHKFSCDGFKDHFSTTGSEYASKKSFLWWNSFHNMYFKRPDLYEAGTKVNTQEGYVCDPKVQINPTAETPGLYDSLTNDEVKDMIPNFILNTIKPNVNNTNVTDPIITSWLYTKQNLENLQNLFDQQAKHPELFFDETKDASWNYPFMNIDETDEYIEDNATINNSRFLHINRFYFNNEYTDVPEVFSGGNGFDVLGDDGFCQFTYDNKKTGVDKRTFDCDHRSVPFFFRYNPENRNLDTGGDNINNLSYGFATKTRKKDIHNTERDFITLHPEMLNGLRAEVFNMRNGQKPFTQGDTTKFSEVAEWQGGDILGKQDPNHPTGPYTMIGWDRHFTSWGNMAIMETTGQAPVSYDGLAKPTAIGQGIPYTSTLVSPGGTISGVKISHPGTGGTPGTHTGVTGVPYTQEGGSPEDKSTGQGAKFTIVIGSTGVMTGATIENGGLYYQNTDLIFLNLGTAMYLQITGTKTNILDTQIPVIEMAYAGTNNIACVYDQVSNKFGFEYLHMPEFVGNEYDAGATNYITQPQDPTADAVSYNIPIDDDAGNEVYKINKRLRKLAFCPDMTPYMDMTAEIQTSYTAGNPGQTRIDPMNNAFSPWIIYDSKGGVAINFGQSAKIDEDISPISQSEAWNNSVLGILGFSYEQFNPDVITAKNTYQGRLTGNNINSVYFPTTNGELLTADTNTYYMNPFGAVLYTNQLPTCLDLKLTAPSTFNNGDGATLSWHFLPSIVKPTKSMKLEGVNLPRVTLNPYMTIRSDLVTHKKYIGGVNSGLSLPIIGIVQKINADKDYLETAIGEVFTVTEPMKFSSITTAICDPDGSLSLLDQGSAVIYKIAKNDNINNYSFLEEFKKNLK